MQKMVKTGFRGERKGILTPSLSQGEGECSDGKNNETFPFTHTQLSLATFKGGKCSDGKRIMSHPGRCGSHGQVKN